MLKVTLAIVAGFAFYTFAGAIVGSIAAEAITEIFAPINTVLAQVAK